MEFHEVASIFPMMDGQSFADLKEDIRQSGLLEPIWILDGKVLDGRNRYRVCQELGIEPTTRQWVGKDPVKFVVSMNLRRRHLKESQRVLVACEFSGIVRDAFRAKGHDAWSCDLLPPEKEGPYFQGDVLTLLNEGWDLMIAHPPCTYLCAGGHNWLNRKPEWKQGREDALVFVRKLLDAPIPRIALENPIGVINSRIRKPDQILRAWMFGYPYKKDICLWLKNLPKLIPTHVPEGWIFGGDQFPKERKTFDFWSSDRYTDNGGSKKSITFQGIANAMADQWG